MKEFHDKPNRYVTQIVIKVGNLERSLDFYKHIMGFRVLERKEKEVILSVDGLTPLITLIQPKNAIEKIPNRTGLYHFALLLPNRLQLGLFLKNIEEKQYPIIGGSNHGVSEAIYLQDPDNNGIEVYCDVDSSKWTWENKKVEMITIPLDYDDLVAKTGSNKWKGMPEDTIIGHIHLHVADLIEARKFYEEGLGFDVVMEMGMSALFLSSGGYHHHIGLNIWNGIGAKPLPENAAGMDYYTIMFPDAEARKDAINRLIRLGYQVVIEEFDIYTKDPSGNTIKLIK